MTGIVAGIAGVVAVTALAYGLLRPHDSARSQPATQNADVQRSAPPANGSPASSPPITPASPTPDVKPGYDKPAALTLLGTVLGDAQTISTRQPARIAQVLVKEGQAVRRGQLLALLDLPEARTAQTSAFAGIQAAQSQVSKAQAGRAAQIVKADADMDTAQAGVNQASDRLKQAHIGVQAAQSQDSADLARARESVRKADIGLLTAQRTLKSLEELSTVGGVARNDLEGARAQVSVAQSDLDTARDAVKQIQTGPNATPNTALSSPPASGSPRSARSVNSALTFRVANARQEEELARDGLRQAQNGLRTAQRAKSQIVRVADADVQAAQAGVTQARAGLTGAQSGAQAAQLTSALDGVASSVTARVGEVAQPGQPLVVVISFANARIEALVPARQLGLISTGQNAQARLDASPNLPLALVVSSISRVAEPDGRAFRVTFRLLRPISTLRVGQTARITLNREQGTGNREQ